MNIEQLNASYSIADQLEFIAGKGGLPMIQVNSSKAKALISIHAGQVLSFKPANEPEDVLFLSEKAYYQDGKRCTDMLAVVRPRP
jgi:glucose-6-phosphate 1-epimerase